MKILNRTIIPASLTLILLLTDCSSKPAVIEHGIFAPSRHEYVLGQDGVCSIKFSDEVTLWTFADTILGRWKNGKGPVSSLKNDAEMEGMISNSLAWSGSITGKNFRDIRLTFLTDKGRVAQFIKNQDYEDPLYNRFWALDGVRTGNKVYVYYLHVFVPDYRKLLEFNVLYVGLAVWDIPDGWKPGDAVDFRRLGPLFPAGSPAFGASVISKDGYIYIAGHSKKESSFPLYLARVAESSVEKPGDYEFLSSGGKWVKEIGEAEGFFGDVSGECSISYNRKMKEYIIVYSRIFTGEIITVRFSDFNKLSGAEKIAVYTPPVKEGEYIWPYSGKEIFSEGDRIFVIYIDPVMYQPVLIELRY